MYRLPPEQAPESCEVGGYDVSADGIYEAGGPADGAACVDTGAEGADGGGKGGKTVDWNRLEILAANAETLEKPTDKKENRDFDPVGVAALAMGLGCRGRSHATTLPVSLQLGGGVSRYVSALETAVTVRSAANGVLGRMEEAPADRQSRADRVNAERRRRALEVSRSIPSQWAAEQANVLGVSWAEAAQQKNILSEVPSGDDRGADQGIAAAGSPAAGPTERPLTKREEMQRRIDIVAKRLGEQDGEGGADPAGASAGTRELAGDRSQDRSQGPTVIEAPPIQAAASLGPAVDADDDFCPLCDMIARGASKPVRRGGHTYGAGCRRTRR